MTSVTVAGGSFDVPRHKRRERRSLTARQERWLRYGAGVSIAGLLAADGLALVAMLRDAADDAAARERAAAAAAAASAASTPAPDDAGTTGAGFAAFDVPSDVEAYLRALSGAAAASGAADVPSAAPAPAGFTTVPTIVLPASVPTAAPGDGVPRGPSTPPAPPGASTPPAASDPSLVEQLVGAVESVVPEAAPVVAVVEEVVPAVESVVDEAVAPVTDTVPAPLAAAADSTVGGIL